MSYRYPMLCKKCNKISTLNLENDKSETEFPLKIKCHKCGESYRIYFNDISPMKWLESGTEIEYEIIDINNIKTMQGLISEIRSGYEKTMKLVNLLTAMIDKDANEFTGACVDGFDKIGIHEKGIDKRYLPGFYKQPFFCIPVCNDYIGVPEFNRLLFVPKFIKPVLGFQILETLSHRIYIVNYFTMFTFDMPEHTKKLLGFERTLDIKVHGKKITGIDIVLHENELTEFANYDIDSTDEHISLKIFDMPEAARWFVSHGVKFGRMFSFNFSSSDESSLDSRIPGTTDQKIWWRDFKNFGRIICTAGSKEDFLDMVLRMIDVLSMRVLFIINDRQEYMEEMFSEHISKNSQLVIIYTKKHSEKLGMTTSDFNMFNLIVIDSDTWDGYDYGALMGYRNGLLIYTSDPLLDCLSEMQFSLAVHAMASYTSFGTNPAYKKEEEAKKILTSSLISMLK